MNTQSWIKFLGTAGARFVMIKQIRSSAGIWFHLKGFNLLVDPGPGTLVRCAASKPRLDPTQLNAIFLSHIHLDHSTDINVMIEAMTSGRMQKKGMLFAPREALEGENRVILPYLKPSLQHLFILTPGATFQLNETWTLTIPPFQHQHPVETYGYRLESTQFTIGHITDTAFFPQLLEGYAGVDILILNVVRVKGGEDTQKGILHLNVDQAREIIRAINPAKTILTHFGMTMIKAHPWEVAASLSQEVGSEVIAASDGMKFNLTLSGNSSSPSS